jgi:phenylalanine-4-hydroxylase
MDKQSTDTLPQHLQKYIVSQNYEKYTPVDQAAWRFVLRQLTHFLSTHAHECYLDGLKKTGISIDTIPKISDISAKIEKFGWKALPVSGFIPPAAFMELQALSVLPIASDMRSINHIMYTPAPDIVHEAAGHAPILVNEEFAQYLKNYAQVARKAIISSEDLNLYEAIRLLSDVKENPTSSKQDIVQAEQNLQNVIKEISFDSEATLLGRMNWWTAEYGLIGDLENPKIFGAGLLSSAGESKECLKPHVKKIPLTVDCIKTSYDITEPQPQLFVTPNFAHLTKVLEDLADMMAYRRGGKESLDKMIEAKTVNTAVLNSGLQISGKLISYIIDEKSKEPAYLKFEGPCQLSVNDHQLPYHGVSTHAHGFGSPLGYLKGSQKCLSLYTSAELEAAGIKFGNTVKLEFSSGVFVEGTVTQLTSDKNLMLVSFKDCKVTLKGMILFDPAWGAYDMAIGSQVTSVFGGPADRLAYGSTSDFVAARVTQPKFTDAEKKLHQLYQRVREMRENLNLVKQNFNLHMAEKTSELIVTTMAQLDQEFSKDWLLRLEIYELLEVYNMNPTEKDRIHKQLLALAETDPSQKASIFEGLSLVGKI